MAVSEDLVQYLAVSLAHVRAGKSLADFEPELGVIEERPTHWELEQAEIMARVIAENCGPWKRS